MHEECFIYYSILFAFTTAVYQTSIYQALE
jgi:hypothetical protein